jgi:hypothetical protein
VATAAATAQGVALNASAGCSNGNLDITLTTVGANREGWRATDLAGATISQGEGTAGLPNFSGTFVGFKIPFSPLQPADASVASYAYVGETPPSATDTAEFFVSQLLDPPGPVVAMGRNVPDGQQARRARPQDSRRGSGPAADRGTGGGDRRRSLPPHLN